MELDKQERIKEKLGDNIEKALGELENLQLGSDEHTAATNNIVKLYQLKQEDEKLEVTSIQQDEELEQRVIDRKERRKQWILDTVLHVGEVVAMTGVYVGLTKWGFKFEETGSITSKTMRDVSSGFSSFIKPRRK